MARVLVVGSDMQGEQALLQRLRGVAALPAGVQVSSCNALDACDLLVIKDTPALRNAALRMLSLRPWLHCWVEDRHGRLHGGLSDAPVPLDDAAIARALGDMQAGNRDTAAAHAAPPRATAEAATGDIAEGMQAIIEQLRSALASGGGRLSLCLGGEPVLLLDIEQEQAIALRAVAGLPQLLADSFEALQLQVPTSADWQRLDAGLPRHPLRPLLWQWGQASSVRWPDLDRQLDAGAAVRLSRWPDFRVLGHDHDGFRLCSLLLKLPCTAAQCMQLLALPPAQVRGFIHAAYLGGYAVIEAPSRKASALSVAGTGGLLARMWRSMRQRPGRVHA
ncbi:hypothetical protein [Stenotrophomonas mori]|uniref:Uncharacterized protein n=1 Tax=Stenotrophomonas mori TaxID=2871096 RepID=A0ABT0SJG3_9GAMM|nr:hypothetical protein [Stenotrophomonas mori]MCL7715473.1 hypothetical protein [Stenotrophomonas mori]